MGITEIFSKSFDKHIDPLIKHHCDLSCGLWTSPDIDLCLDLQYQTRVPVCELGLKFSQKYSVPPIAVVSPLHKRAHPSQGIERMVCSIHYRLEPSETTLPLQSA